MANKPIWSLTASELIRKTRAGNISASEVTFATLEQIKRVNPDLNAIVDDMAVEAMRRAE